MLLTGRQRAGRIPDLYLHCNYDIQPSDSFVQGKLGRLDAYSNTGYDKASLNSGIE